MMEEKRSVPRESASVLFKQERSSAGRARPKTVALWTTSRSQFFAPALRRLVFPPTPVATHQCLTRCRYESQPATARIGSVSRRNGHAFFLEFAILTVVIGSMGRCFLGQVSQTGVAHRAQSFFGGCRRVRSAVKPESRCLLDSCQGLARNGPHGSEPGGAAGAVSRQRPR